MVLVAWLEAVQIRMNPTTHTYIETHIILSNSTCEVTFYFHDLRALYTTAPFHKVLHFDLKSQNTFLRDVTEINIKIASYTLYPKKTIIYYNFLTKRIWNDAWSE